MRSVDEVIDEAWDRTAFDSTWITTALISYPLTTRVIEAGLANTAYHRYLASTHHCPPHVLASLAWSDDADVASLAAANPNIDYDLIAGNDDLAAVHPNTPSKRIADLCAQHLIPAHIRQPTHPRRRMALLRSPHLPADLRRALLHHGDPVTLVPLLANPSITAAEARAALDSTSAESRPSQTDAVESYLTNPNADPDWLVEVLYGDLRGIHDDDRRLSYRALAHPNLPTYHWTHYLTQYPRCESTADFALDNPNATADGLVHIAARYGSTFYSAIRLGLHPNATTVVLAHLPASIGNPFDDFSRLRRWAPDGAVAAVALTLLDSFSGSFGELLDTARGIVT